MSNSYSPAYVISRVIDRSGVSAYGIWWMDEAGKRDLREVCTGLSAAKKRCAFLNAK